uniref:Uncharacterized protein n=1 Tax=Cyprinodon variegatus TaxID=28743 RepID=A0A3Q2G2Q6_CYPVA
YSSSPDSCVRTRKRPRNRGNKPRHGLSTDASVAKFLLDRILLFVAMVAAEINAACSTPPSLRELITHCCE